VTDFKIHPAAELFPMLPERQLDEMAQDICSNGQRMPVMVWRNQVIDGRNRLKACELIGADPWVQKCDKDFATDDDVIRYIFSINLLRRHLSSSERAALAVELLPMLKTGARERQTRGVSQKIDEASRATQEAAEITGTNRQYVHDAAKLKEQSPEKFAEVRRGEKTIPQAMKELKPRVVRANIDQVVAEEEKLVDGIISDLTNATKKLRKCVDSLGLSAQSVSRVSDAVNVIADLIP